MNTPVTVKSKEEVQKQCATFLKRNKFKMAVVTTYSDFGDREADGYEIYLVPKDSNYLFKDEIRKNGILVHHE